MKLTLILDTDKIIKTEDLYNLLISELQGLHKIEKGYKEISWGILFDSEGQVKGNIDIRII